MTRILLVETSLFLMSIFGLDLAVHQAPQRPVVRLRTHDTAAYVT